MQQQFKIKYRFILVVYTVFLTALHLLQVDDGNLHIYAQVPTGV